MKKPTKPTREQLQAEIEQLHNMLKTSKATLSLNAQTISTLEKQKQDDLSSSRDAAYKDVDRLEKKLCSRFHWIETVVAVVVISTFTFTIGLNISRKPSKREKLNFNVPMEPVVVCTNLTAVGTNIISSFFITNRIESKYLSNGYATFPQGKPVKLYRSIVTRKGAEMLRP